MADPIFNSPITNPFGLTAVGLFASPTFADIDGDGDLDASVGNYDGNTLFYQNIGTAGSAAFAAPVTNPSGLTDVGLYATPTFADIDADGDLDAFIGERYGNTLFYQNTGTTSSAAFAAPVTNPSGLTDVGYEASPTLADIDGDGDLDAFIGELFGNTLFYLNTGTASTAVFAAPVTNLFGLTNVGIVASPTFADIDGDGDLDAFIGNRYGNNTLFYRNTGNAGSAVFAAPVSNPFGLTDVGYFASPTFADIDGDGDWDAFVGNSVGNTLFYLNNAAVRIVQTGANTAVTEGGASDTYTVVLNGAPTADVTINLDTTNHQVSGSASTLTFTPANWNTPQTVTVTAVNDTVGEGTHTGVIQHTVTSADTRYNGLITNVRIAITDNDLPVADFIFNSPTTNTGLIDVGSIASPTFADINGDGDLDAFIGNNYGNTLFYRNTPIAGIAAFAAPVTNLFGLTNVGYAASPTFADVDGDGDWDALVGNSDGKTLFYRNTGNTGSAVFAAPVSNPFGLTDVGYNSSPTFADIDGDGDWDAFVGERYDTTLFYRNNTAPILTTPTAINYTDTVFDDTFAPASGALIASDIDSAILTYSITSGIDNGNDTISKSSAYGTLTLTKASGAYSFAPNDAAIEALTLAANASFTLSVSDGALSDSKTLTVNIAQNGTTESIGNDTLTGTPGNDKLNGLAGADSINGLAGADTLYGGTGADAMTGGDGSDIYYVDDIGDNVTEGNAVAGTGGTDIVYSYLLLHLNGQRRKRSHPGYPCRQSDRQHAQQHPLRQY